jgi:hypothetical protein
MTEEIVRGPEEANESGESRSPEQQNLENATLDPRAYVEQTGDYQQAEAIQNALTAIVDNASNPSEEISRLHNPIPLTPEQVLDKSQSSEAIQTEVDQIDELEKIEIPNLEPPPIVNIVEEEGAIKSMSETSSKDPVSLEAGGSRSGISEIAKVEVPNLEPPPIVNIAEQEGTIKSMGATSSKDPAYLKDGGHQSGMGEIAKIDSFTDEIDKSRSGISKNEIAVELTDEPERIDQERNLDDSPKETKGTRKTKA